MSYETYAHVQDMVEVEEKESVKMKGINREIKVFSVLKRRTSKQRKKIVSSKDKINWCNNCYYSTRFSSR